MFQLFLVIEIKLLKSRLVECDLYLAFVYLFAPVFGYPTYFQIILCSTIVPNGMLKTHVLCKLGVVAEQ